MTAPLLPPAVDPILLDLYERIADCPNCVLAKTRTRTVPGSGPATSEVMFVGEGPGQREDEQGVPFVGPAGKFLDELLGAAGWTRNDVYVTNVVKCRPAGNRDPEPEEIAACAPFLDEALQLLNVRLIVTLGRFSMARWFPGASISRIHGQPRRLEDRRIVVPMYHPAAALRNGGLRPVLLADFARLPALLDEARTAAGTEAAAAATGVVLRGAVGGAEASERLL
ncbi:MAG: uracil-DNA glycosylase [Dehalococcoidia bacterium]|nr:uracil-DNA glycosylase [Dehalococcoidia bacterium]